MHRFFVESEQIQKDQICIVGNDVNHIKNVLRMRPGEEVEISDGNEMQYLCEILEITATEVVAQIKKSQKSVEPSLFV
jgi:16S rRNA (uracil1498-N3)-methyltransferase